MHAPARQSRAQHSYLPRGAVSQVRHSRRAQLLQSRGCVGAGRERSHERCAAHVHERRGDVEYPQVAPGEAQQAEQRVCPKGGRQGRRRRRHRRWACQTARPRRRRRGCSCGGGAGNKTSLLASHRERQNVIELWRCRQAPQARVRRAKAHEAARVKPREHVFERVVRQALEPVQGALAGQQCAARVALTATTALFALYERENKIIWGKKLKQEKRAKPHCRSPRSGAPSKHLLLHRLISRASASAGTNVTNLQTAI